VKGVQSVNQWVQTHAEGPAAYYKVALYAPYLYGLVQMVILALFPLAALWALWPGHWKALLNFGKLFVSVKLWVVCWAALAAFNQGRYSRIQGRRTLIHHATTALAGLAARERQCTLEHSED